MGLSDGDRSSNFRQNVVVMRHGDRLDNVRPLWSASAPRPWDPPLADDGRVRAFTTGNNLRRQLGFPIHRVFVSPFLRCLQTAAEAVSALCAVQKSDDHAVVIDPSKVKVSVEYGLSEMMNSLAIRSNVAPKDGVFSFDISQCKSALPAGTIDNAVEMVYKELPRWEETVEDARARYLHVIKILADKYPSENLLLVTHGEGVGSAVSGCCDDDVVVVAEVEYCAYSILQRSVVFSGNKLFSAEEFVGSLRDAVGIQIMQAQEP